ncbi:MAG: outer membrane beta-barrel protein [Hyphomicrobium sp.]
MTTFGARRALRASALAIGSAALFVSLTCNTARADMLAPIWTGAYVGFHGGAKWADVDTDFSSTFSATDITGGGHLGYNVGLGGIVLGIEGDANLDSTRFDYSYGGGGSGSFETDWSGSIRGRIGMPVGPALLYATAGYAWTEATLAEKSAAGGSFSSSHSFDGVVYGVGAEAYVLPNMSLRLEALRFDYSSDELSLTGANNVLQEFDPSETVVRAGVTFHLN